MFEIPALVYAMSRRSDVFDCELIGFDLAWRTIGLIPPWKVLRSSDERWAQLDMSASHSNGSGSEASLGIMAREIVGEIGNQSAFQTRIRDGASIFGTLLERFDTSLQAILLSDQKPLLAMAGLVQERAREARVYHSDFKLKGRRLSHWFDEARDDPLPLVEALGRSRLIRPGQPERSRLVNGLIAEDGAMFRIFSEDDVDVIKRWILSLAEEPGEVLPDTGPFDVKGKDDRYRPVAGGDLDMGDRPSDIRSAYYLLQGRALAPRSREFSRAYCSFWLSKAGDCLDETDRSLPPDWRPGQLREWLLSKHDQHAEQFQEDKALDLPSRETVIEQTLQLAPLTLIDGAWLQGFTEVSLASSRHGAPLFATYWDELGNGEWRINHPKIYRDVLAAMEIVLPKTGAREFAQDLRLKDESFRLPVYWLAIGKFPITFQPEILGLNLAMELSGVGGSYRSARIFLKNYNFPTIFVDLHNTIDNVSTGHSAWAADAIDAYIQSTRDLIPVEQSWARIRTGYESLSPIVADPNDLDFFAKTSGSAAALSEIRPLHHGALYQGEYPQ